MRNYLLLLCIGMGLITGCQRPVAYFQPTDHPDYTAPVADTSPPLLARTDSAYQLPEALPMAATALPEQGRANPASHGAMHPAKNDKKQRTVGNVSSSDEIIHQRVSREPSARRAANQSLVAGLIGIISLAVAILVPNAASLILILPVAGIWAVIAGIRGINRSRKKAPERGPATAGLIMGIVLLLATIFYAIVIAALAAVFR
ncbi:DUF308 domain-containing protein [Nibrella saemangeumensis]